jgi:hypothetical protein
MLKRVKVSEGDEMKVQGGDHFQLGESAMAKQPGNGRVRKSVRKKTKSQLLREVEEEVIATPSKRKMGTKARKEFTKIVELSEKAGKREEKISSAQYRDFLVEFEYEYEKVDPKPVCFCQTCSYGDMVA